MNESFQKLNDTFNMDGADVDLDDDIKQSENEGDDSYLKKQKYKLNSHDYLIMELQDQIERLRAVAEEMRQCCRVGAPPRMFEPDVKDKWPMEKLKKLSATK